MFTDWSLYRKRPLPISLARAFRCLQTFYDDMSCWVWMCSFSFSYVCGFLFQVPAVLLPLVFVCLFVFSFKCYYRFYWFHKTTELFLFSAYSKDTSCASTLEHWKSAKVQISLLKAWIFMYIPLFSFLSQIRSHGLGIFSQWLWGVPVPVCSTINYLVLSQAVKLSFVLCGPQASSICIILSHARQKTIPWTDC